MTDFDQRIFNNPELGQVNTCDFLDEVQAQVLENQNAKKERRKARKVVPVERFGRYRGLVTNGPVKFKDGTAVNQADNMNDYWQTFEDERVAHGVAPFDPAHLEIPDDK